MLHMVHQDHLDQEVGQNLLDITHKHVEREIYVQNQHQYMEQLINMNWFFHNQEFTSVGYQTQFLKDLFIFCLRKLFMIIWLLIQLLMDLLSTKELFICTFVITQ